LNYELNGLLSTWQQWCRRIPKNNPPRSKLHLNSCAGEHGRSAMTTVHTWKNASSWMQWQGWINNGITTPPDGCKGGFEVRLMSICDFTISSHKHGATACTQTASKPGKPCNECSEQEAARKIGETQQCRNLLDRAKRIASLDKWREALRRGWVRKG
jgi:hypothetical protein